VTSRPITSKHSSHVPHNQPITIELSRHLVHTDQSHQTISPSAEQCQQKSTLLFSLTHQPSTNQNTLSTPRDQPSTNHNAPSQSHDPGGAKWNSTIVGSISTRDQGPGLMHSNQAYSYTACVGLIIDPGGSLKLCYLGSGPSSQTKNPVL
jgi:hypothetical protein